MLDELLPREPPSCFTAAEVAEFERRIWALGIFDAVEVHAHDDSLVVRVREKWTLIPGADFAIANTLRDSFFLLRLTESNLFGYAQTLRLSGYYVERTWGGEATWAEHENAARRFTFEGAARYYGSSIFFEYPSPAWDYTRTAGWFGLRFPFHAGSQWRFAILLSAYRERSTGDVPPGLTTSGYFGGGGVRITWDGYAWHDLAPKGFRWWTEIVPGWFFGRSSNEARHSVVMQGLASIRITDTTALLFNNVIEAGNPGSPNHSFLLTNLRGVRGLPDNLYRNVAHAFANIELRFAAQLAPRWYLQGAALLDAAVYSRLNEEGRPRAPASALSAGIGLRLVPTLLTDVVPRLDVGSLLVPECAWYATIGISQYF